MECTETSNGLDESVDGAALEEKREQQRHNSATHRAKVKEFEAKGAEQFKEMVKWVSQIHNLLERRVDEGLQDLASDKEPKFKRRIMILEMANSLLRKLHDMVLMELYFADEEGNGGKEEKSGRAGKNALRCDWCGRWLEVRKWSSGDNKVVSV